MAEVTGILLAAGVSSRFGSNKLLHTLDSGLTLAATAATRLRASLPHSVAVLRPEDAALADIFLACGLGVIPCPAARQGMGYSLACGVRATANAAGWVVLLADMPGVQVATVREVSLRLVQGATIVAPYYRGRRGHPVGFHQRLRDPLLDLEGDIGARGLVDRHVTEVVRLEVDDPGVLLDIDRPEDLVRKTPCID
jgi:molybdenum cofactor cytidylyltransferase